MTMLNIKKMWLQTIGLLLLAFFPCLVFGLEVVSGDYQSILNAKSNSLTVWNVSGKSEIYVFDFPGLTMQGRTFNRATQLNEQVQSQPYPKVLNNEEFTSYLESIRRTNANFAFGHDILVSELVRFFNLADQDKLELFPEEIQLRDFLISQQLMRPWRGFYQAMRPSVAILSIPQMQAKKVDEPMVSELARRAIFSHEMAHGEYFANQYYAAYCQRYWTETLNDKQRKDFLGFFKKLNYDVSQGDLVINEMQAYLMFTPDPNSFSASKLGVSDEELESMRKMFRQGNPPTRLSLH